MNHARMGTLPSMGSNSVHSVPRNAFPTIKRLLAPPLSFEDQSQQSSLPFMVSKILVLS